MPSKSPFKIIVCPDSFKGSLDANEITDLIISNLNKILPPLYPKQTFSFKGIPLADGGEGTSEMLKNKFPHKKSIKTLNPVGEPLETYYHIDDSNEIALIESAAVIGLNLIDKSERNPLFTNSYGLGEIVKKIANDNLKEIYISLGGTGTCDGGTGFLNALGINFFDKDCKLLIGNGYNLQFINKIKGEITEDLKLIKFHYLSDVCSPLTGPTGASLMFSKQKGANNEQMYILEKGMKNFLERSISFTNAETDAGSREGAGAAGGLGFALNTFLKADYLSGIDFVLNNVNFCEEIKDAALIITGEGKIDRQSVEGKVLSGILKQNKYNNVPIISLGGMVEDKKDVLDAGVKEVFSISDPNLTLGENMRKDIASKNLIKTLKSIFQGNKYFN